MQASHRSKLLGLFAWAILTLASGCQFTPKAPEFWPWSKTKEPPTPDRILPVWTDSVLHQPNQPGVRGFGGRIYFYAKDNTEPIEVDGSLAVYVFDAEDLNVSAQQPLRKFVYTADQFKTHMSKTSIGPSYSVWLPWGEVGGPPRRLSLITRFEGRQGGTTLSDPTIKLLPGIPVNKAGETDQGLAKETAGTPFRVASHAQVAPATPAGSPATEAAPARRVETIDLPPAFQRHLQLRSSIPNAVPSLESKDPSSLNAEAAASVDATATSDASEAIAGPVTTQVFDYRSRSNHSFQANEPALDIRQGRSIPSLPRATLR